MGLIPGTDQHLLTLHSSYIQCLAGAHSPWSEGPPPLAIPHSESGRCRDRQSLGKTPVGEHLSHASVITLALAFLSSLGLQFLEFVLQLQVRWPNLFLPLGWVRDIGCCPPWAQAGPLVLLSSLSLFRRLSQAHPGRLITHHLLGLGGVGGGGTADGLLLDSFLSTGVTVVPLPLSFQSLLYRLLSCPVHTGAPWLSCGCPQEVQLC